MSNLFVTGFDDHDAAGLAYEWVVSGSPTIVSGRTGNCLRCGTGQGVLKALNNTDTIFVGFAFKIATISGTSALGFFTVGDGTRTHLILVVDATGTIALWRCGGSGAGNNSTNVSTLLATSTNTLVANTFYYIEFTCKIHDTTGTYEVKVNGSSVGWIPAASSKDTNNGGTAVAAYVQFCAGVASVNHDFDDIYVNDTAGSVCNGFMGDMRVDFHLPDADGANTGWTPSAGGTHFGTIDENPQNTTDYNSTATLNAKDTLSVEAFKNSGADIAAIQINLLSQKSDAGTCALQTVIRESGADTDSGVSIFPSTGWLVHKTNYSLAVGDGKRVGSGFDACEFGYKKTA